MKKITIIIGALTFLFCTSIFISCKKNNSITGETQLTEGLSIFKTKFNNEFNSISWDTKRIINPSLMNDEVPNINFTLIDINLNGYNAYYVEFDGKGFFVDYSKHNKGIKVFDVVNSDEYCIIPFAEGKASIPDFNSEYSLYQKTFNPNESNLKSGWRYWLCAGGCGAVSLAIAASDGPAPFMDILAVVFFADCTLDCAEKHL